MRKFQREHTDIATYFESQLVLRELLNQHRVRAVHPCVHNVDGQGQAHAAVQNSMLMEEKEI